ncbi:elongation factor Ts, mitochondrial-like [Styela clava]|uniref:elongation factor Ts, mitochondrial-like n=1 Tax=Styela clava TaxID=7725 RepID=UPI00193990C6|nr:elongation factor Ts, mitochondrial-like [Styela clava]
MATIRPLFKSGKIVQNLLIRTISSSPWYAIEPATKDHSPSEGKSNKQILLKLRKDTGFPLAKCKQTLLKNDYNYEQALEEMNENALKEGWSKMSMLSGRDTSQGLVAAQRTGKYATLLEVNCESDFVAKTSEFQSFVAVVTRAIIDNLSKDAQEHVELESKEILALPVTMKSQNISDVLAATIGKLKENIRVSKALFSCVDESNNEFIGVYTHPDLQTPVKGGKLPLMGRYAALVKMKTRSQEPQRTLWLQSKARDLAQHIVGMNPSCIGSRTNAPIVGVDSVGPIVESDASDSVERNEEDKPLSQLEDEEIDLEEQYFNNELPTNFIDSDQLLHQPFLLDPNITVQNWLDIHNLEVLYFIRYRLGSDNV